MFTLTLSLDSLSMYIVALDIIVLLSYVLYVFNKKRLIENAVNKISEFIADYFMSSGAEVRVTCIKVDGDKRFVVMIESKPLKRFRYSNVLESNLISHAYKITGNTIEKIYWRFPIEADRTDSAETVRGQNSEVANTEDDLYFADAYERAKAQAEYKVSELTWDEYAENKKTK